MRITVGGGLEAYRHADGQLTIMGRTEKARLSKDEFDGWKRRKGMGGIRGEERVDALGSLGRERGYLKTLCWGCYVLELNDGSFEAIFKIVW